MKKKLYYLLLSSSFTNAEIDLNILAQAEQSYANKQTESAISYYKKALNSNDNIAQTLAQLGNAYQGEKKYDNAIALYRTALDLNDAYINVYLLLAECYQAIGDTAHAQEIYETALKKTPTYVPLLIPAARFFKNIKQYDRALNLAKAAFALAPTNLDVHLLIGRIFNDQGKADEAIAAYRAATKIAPNSFHAHYNLGFALKIRGQLSEAQKELQTASSIAPHEVVAHVGLAHAYWADNKLPEAWEQFEYRWRIADPSKGLRPQDLSYPLWDGISSLQGKTVLMFSEQGLGDTLQFIRFAQEIKKRGGKTVCAVQKPLRSLLTLCPYIDVVMTTNQAIPVDYQAPLMSMPYILKLNTITSETPYLHADKKLAQEWKATLSKDRSFKIGLCWEVDTEHDQIKSSPLEWRSVPLKDLAPLAQLPQVSFYSLQKINGEDQLKNLPAGFIVRTFDGDFDNSHGRFMDTAAVIDNLDLIISADTAIAHLAGGLNKPVWLMLPYSPECRWQFNRPDSDWYPTMRIFRQTKPFDWSTMVQTMRTELAKIIDNTSAQKDACLQSAAQCHTRADINGALKWYEKALTFAPNDPQIIHDIAFMHRLRGDMPAALETLKQEIALRPNYPMAHIAQAHAFWVMGDYAHAWKEREWRWQAKGFDPNKQTIALLKKESNLKNKTVLLYAEDGLGDTLQFLRFAQLLKNRGARIILEAQAPLVPLLRTMCPFIDTVTSNKLASHLANTAIDYQAPLMSLPHILAINETNLPNKPYLTGTIPLSPTHKSKLHANTYAIGICWHVEPKHELHASPVCKRAMQLKDFAPLAALKHCSLYSLHKQHDANELTAWQKKLNLVTFGTDFDGSTGAFIDTAALMNHLDLIITVDTSIAHLAGALGKKVWLLLPTSPDCRWQLKRTDSPWYPTMRIFRQKEYGNWNSVMHEVKHALIEEFPDIK